MYHTDIPTDWDPKGPQVTLQPTLSTAHSLTTRFHLLKDLCKAQLILYQIIPHPIIADIGHNYHSTYFVPGKDSTETE